MSDSKIDDDLTHGRECLQYAYEKFEELTQNSGKIRLKRELITFFVEIVRNLATAKTLDKIDLLIPEMIRPQYQSKYNS